MLDDIWPGGYIAHMKGSTRNIEVKVKTKRALAKNFRKSVVNSEKMFHGRTLELYNL